jgi:hypothetical protein
MLTSHHITGILASERVADLRRAAATGSEARTTSACRRRPSRRPRVAGQRRRIFATARGEGQ